MMIQTYYATLKVAQMMKRCRTYLCLLMYTLSENDQNLPEEKQQIGQEDEGQLNECIDAKTSNESTDTSNQNLHESAVEAYSSVIWDEVVTYGQLLLEMEESDLNEAMNEGNSQIHFFEEEQDPDHPAVDIYQYLSLDDGPLQEDNGNANVGDENKE
ncbi:hypothetical protein BJV82DRAFT_18742 [Fennellomyces sp. T-0311]|nr:hypothetical protein BJV82DRAFT_18742 [Fennellomyces sp. T-0311]